MCCQLEEGEEGGEQEEQEEEFFEGMWIFNHPTYRQEKVTVLPRYR